MNLTNKQRKAISGKISSLFDAFKVRLLGRFFKGPAIVFEAYRESVDPLGTIEGIYRHALVNLYGPKADVDEEEVEHLSDIASNYVDAKRMQITNHILMDVASAKNPQQANKSIRDNMVKVDNYMKLLTESEAKMTQAYANKSGITQVAASVGDSDPTVAFLGVIDNKLCLEESEMVMARPPLPSNSKYRWMPIKDIKTGYKMWNPFSANKQSIKFWSGYVSSVHTRSAEVIKLELDNGKSIVCTPEHPILIKSGTIFHFIEAGLITDKHNIVMSDELVHSNARLSLAARKFMNGHIDAWSYIKSNIGCIIQDLHDMPLQQVRSKYGMSIKDWDRYMIHVVKSYWPDYKSKRSYNNNNAEYMKKKTSELKLELFKKECNYIHLGGDKWFTEKIRAGYSVKQLAKEFDLSIAFMRSKMHALGLMSLVKARGANSAWAKHGTNLSQKIHEKNVSFGKFKKASKPEIALMDRLCSIGFEVERQCVISRMTVDGLIKSLNIVIEYDGSGHDRFKFKKGPNRLSQSQIDYGRDKELRRLGYKILRVNSPKDTLPTESDLKNKLEHFIKSGKDFEKWHI